MRAVLFDFNGTLFDDTRYHILSWGNYLRRRFGIELTEAQICTQFIGPNNSAIFHSFFGDRYTKEEIHAFSREKEAEYRRVAREDKAHFHLIDGATQVFDLLTQSGIPFALATASERPNVDFYRDELGLAQWFPLERIVYDEGKLASKPDPAFYMEAARRLDMRPSDCLVCEDSLAGIEAARRFGAGCIIAIDRTVPKERLEKEACVHAVIHDYRHFERYLEEANFPLLSSVAGKP